MPPSAGPALPGYLLKLLKSNPNRTDFSMRVRETWRINMTLALAIDFVVAVSCLGLCWAVDVFISPIPMLPLTMAWMVIYGLICAFTWPSIRNPKMAPFLWLYLGFGSVSVAIGLTAGLLDLAIGAPVSIMGLIGVGACWVFYPAQGAMATIGPLTACGAGVIAYLASMGWSVPAGSYWVAIAVCSLTGVVTGSFGAFATFHGAQREHGMRRELEKAVDSAETAVRAKAEFLATMSHEIRTPLNGVIGMVSLLGRSELGDEQREQLQTVERSGHALLTIINDILDFSKIEAGQLDLEEVAFDLSTLANDLRQVAEFSTNGKAVVVGLETSEDTPKWIIGDPTRLRQVLQNLINNAVKFTPHGRVDIKIHATPTADAKYEMNFAVVDNGIGIDQEQQSRLFQPFSQADSSTTRRFGGTGLGLAICKHIVEQMGGQIEIHSQLGVGSTFQFQIVVDAATSEQAAATKLDVGSTLAVGKGQRILLVEDNRVNRKLAKAILKNLELPFDVACDGLEAVELYRPERYAAILMDCSMPRMDGYQATRIIRHLEHGKIPTPIIALTANALTGDREKALRSSMDDHLSKPYTVQDLQQVLGRWMETSEAHRNQSQATYQQPQKRAL